MNSEESASILNNIITYKKGPNIVKRSNSFFANNDIYVIWSLYSISRPQLQYIHYSEIPQFPSFPVHSHPNTPFSGV